MPERRPHLLSNLEIRAAAIRALTQTLEVPCSLHGAAVGEYCDPHAPDVCEARMDRERRTRPARNRAAALAHARAERAAYAARKRKRARKRVEDHINAVARMHDAATKASPTDTTNPEEKS
ncbi:hypothetical protein [Demequina salsinemoris]|uniref:hypothetical protein n=1 Tax=Demequina salsinemoris TaxID=577470 RepID=UPI0007806178|nr:hypothetical protein [Demequina salsinemoris]